MLLTALYSISKYGNAESDFGEFLPEREVSSLKIFDGTFVSDFS